MAHIKILSTECVNVYFPNFSDFFFSFSFFLFGFSLLFFSLFFFSSPFFFLNVKPGVHLWAVSFKVLWRLADNGRHWWQPSYLPPTISSPSIQNNKKGEVNLQCNQALSITGKQRMPKTSNKEKEEKPIITVCDFSCFYPTSASWWARAQTLRKIAEKAEKGS